MKKMIMAAAMLAVVSCFQAHAQNPAPYQFENTIQVTGKAEREIVPDEIYVRIVINEENLKSKQTLEKAEQEMIERLKAIGIDTDKDLKIDNMSSSYREYVLRRNAPKTTSVYQLKVNSAAMLSSAFQQIEAMGISDLSLVKLSHSNIEQYKREIRLEAIRNARLSADEIAQAIGQQAGRAVFIADYSGDVYISAYEEAPMLKRAAYATDQAYQTDLEFRNIKITYSLTAKFELQ